MIKAAKLASVSETEIGLSLGLVKSEGREFKRNLIVVVVKLEENYKHPTVSITFTLLTRNLADNFP